MNWNSIGCRQCINMKKNKIINIITLKVIHLCQECKLEYIIVLLFFIYVKSTYNEFLLGLFDKYVIPICSLFESNLWSIILTIAILITSVVDIIRKYKRRYRYNHFVSFILCIIVCILIFYRFTDKYYYVRWLYHVSYIDVIIVLCTLYIIVDVVNVVRTCKNQNVNNHSDNTKFNILNDFAIVSESEDLFDLKEEVNKLVKQINLLDNDKTWSIAITAQWGVGKTSFLNLVIKQIKESNFEVIEFIPRDCKSYKTIQEDFFTILSTVLSKYDSRFASTLKKYMASLQLIDNRGSIERLINVYKIWDRDGLKSKLKKSFKDLNKKVLVVIDDFDRLSKQEIFEVLKLIDGNASFTNLVFLTAFDKEQVNKLLGGSYKANDSSFVDKFFNVEYSIPSRPYSYISTFIEKTLCRLIAATDNERNLIQQSLQDRISIFAEYIPTMRDAKRYINQVLVDYEYVRGDVLLDEYLLIELIKYKYPDLYRCVYKKVYFESGTIISDTNTLYLKENINDNTPILPILRLLFPNQIETIKQPYRRIFNKHSFDNYFVNRIYNSLRIEDMYRLFFVQWEDAVRIVSEWSSINDKLSDYIEYLDSFDKDKYINVDFLRYAELVAVLACKAPDYRPLGILMRILDTNNIKDYVRDNEINHDTLKSRILNVINGYDPEHVLLRRIHYAYKAHEYDEDSNLIKDVDIWPNIKEYFILVTENPNSDESSLLNFLYNCIDNIEEVGKHKVILNLDCLSAYRKRIEKNPSPYIANFVFLGGNSIHPEFNSIVCEPFWLQIFGDANQCERFIEDCKNSKIENADVAWNFWQLFKANNFEPLQYENQGPVQAKIDSGLRDEYDDLIKLKNIEKDVDDIINNIEISDINQPESYKNLLRQKKNELENIHLYIALRLKILKKIETILNK